MLCRQPAMAAPRLSASIALPDSDPKLIAEMLTTDLGRNASRRSRAAPITLAQGSFTSWPAFGAADDADSLNVRCLIIG